MTYDIYVKNYLDAILEGDRLKCSTIVKDFLQQNPSIKDLYEKILKVSLYQVGELWEANKISVATEHIATAITEGILNELFMELTPIKKLNKKVVVACVENEHHQVGVKMVADIFEMQGWDSYFLGSGIPLSELIRYIKEVSPDIVAISLSIYFNYVNFTRMIKEINEEFPDIIIIVGGQAFSNKKNSLSDKLENLLYIPDLNLLESYIKSINQKRL
ncbi:cobalamin-dependent protein [Labilibaculum sp. DW002]|jgi:MerR family transcriptional regulator, light-induced transcriptional regulator|uniref:Cobalamin-dependent protein n=1 Tax=Paralabilibaculum antarcticum TaxID=2912572 RepID=A0ABT5VWB1_9BACT|nr:cobalamin-dependent protein [Labilibaculum sp. DW002]MDE5419582.1 cobalamin-dependent protein [Labilibaculum sp. DW002]